MHVKFVGLGLCLGVNALAAAALTGTAINGTTGQPAAGDQVLLIAVVSGRAAVTGRGVTDAQGRFQFTAATQRASRMVRVIHQGVGYQKEVPSGSNAVDFQVFDAAPTLEGVTATSYVERIQTEGNMLQAIEEVTVRNASGPPRTLSNSRPFEIRLPAGAQVLAGKVQRPGGQPLTFQPIPSGQPGQYYFPFPLVPGETRFAVAYQLPYQGEALFEPKIPFPLERLTIVLPKSMKFEAKVAGMFQARPEEGEGNVQVTEAVNPAQAPAFRVWGTGTQAKVHPGQPSAPKVETAGSGGVRGTAPAKPSPLPEYRWFILGALALVLGSGAAGFIVHKRKQPLTRQSSVVTAPASSSR